ncbi:MAG TPA: tRNA lysidine(34) synthetase TilS [Burkholderiales bacterium]
MASSRKSRSSEVVACVDAVLAAHVPAGARLTLGFSGGIDSMVLLDVLATLATQHSFQLSCLHVHHGLSPHADRWADFAQRVARQYGIDCAVRKVRLDTHSGLGLEGAARAARYATFDDCDGDFVVFAHQQDDQAETLLLQLVRGAGVAGLAAMPVVRRLNEARAHPHLLRPMLNVSRADIEAYARANALQWVEDESNSDVSLARNFMRHRIMPLLNVLNSAAMPNIARAAAHLGDAVELLDVVARDDLAAASEGERIDLAVLRGIGDVRARNVLRLWLAQHGVAAPDTAELQEALRQLYAARVDAAPLADFGAYALRRFRDRAYLVAQMAALPRDYVVRWNGEMTWTLPELGGRLRFEPTQGEGIVASALRPAATLVRLRQGGERFQPDARRPRRSLKNLLQEHAVAPWQRDRLPLLYCDDRLAFVPGIGVAAALQAATGQAGVLIHWELAANMPGNAINAAGIP